MKAKPKPNSMLMFTITLGGEPRNVVVWQRQPTALDRALAYIQALTPPNRKGNTTAHRLARTYYGVKR